MYQLMTFVALLALGGATRSFYLSDVLAQLLAVFLLASLLWTPHPYGLLKGRSVWIAPVLLGLLVLAATVQLSALGLSSIPSSEVLESAGDALLPVAVKSGAGYVGASIRESLSAAIVPFAVFLVAASLNAAERIRWTIAVLAFGGFSVLLGLMQVAQGPESPLRPFSITNPTEAVGLFANRNHFAALLYVTLVLACAWLPGTAARAMSKHGERTVATVWLAVVFALVLACMAGLAIARSRAGVGLTIVGLLGVGAMIWRTAGTGGGSSTRGISAGGPQVWWKRTRRLVVGVVVFSTIFALQFGLGQILSRFQDDPLQDLRVPVFWTTLDAALAALPFGAGLGSFVGVYATVEKTPHLIAAYVNRAHNDFLEAFLEIGVFVPAAAAVFSMWLLMRGIGLWRRAPSSAHDSSMQTEVQCAALLAILLLLAHSWVDYPLRTGTLSSVFAFLCALMTEPAPSRHPILPATHRSRRQRRNASVIPVVAMRKPSDADAGSWKQQGNIPAEWQREDMKNNR